ncbi:FUSC family protein [Klenkia sp. LSe6-5]|uniref:FUSC family protein n=1 Tax=Klenkia sesuvii TaxID=3103137 RepID=A0ABU8DUX4_9ACTN
MVDRTLRAPAWLEELVRTGRPPVPWRDVVRFALSLAGPLALVGLLGRLDDPAALGAGVFGTTGALAVTLAPQGGPLRTGARRMVAAGGLGTVGLLAGQAATGAGWRPVLVVALVSAAAALMSSVDSALSLGALQLLIYTSLSSGLQTTLSLPTEIGFFVAGGLWAAALVLVQARTEHADPDRGAVAAALDAVADLLTAAGTPRADDARRALTGALNTGYDRVIHSRSTSSGRSRELAELAGLLNAAAPLVEAAVATARTGVAADPVDVAAVRALGTAVTARRPLEDPRPPALEDGPPTRRAVRHAVRLVWDVVGDPEERASAAVVRAPLPWRLRLRDLLDRTTGNADSRAFVVRLTLCMVAAELARQQLPIERPYWVLLTVAVVLKPDFGSVFTRAVQRGAGTLLGVLLGSALLTVLPRGGWVVVALALVAAALPWARNANFGLFSVFQTPLVIMLLDLAAPSPSELVGPRLVDTLIGCVIVLVLGYLLWPGTWRAPLDDALRGTAVALDRFVDAAFTGTAEEARRARRMTFRALTELQTQLQRRLAEPPPISTRAAAWYPVIIQLERTADTVTGAVVAMRAGEAAPPPGQVHVVRRAIRELGDDLRLHRFPDDTEIHAEGVLAPVAREVDAARRLVRAQAPGKH